MLWGLLFAVAALGAAAVIVYQRTKRTTPRAWTHEGTPPPGADEALRVLAQLSGVTGGIVEWRSAPWPSPYERTHLLGGQVLDLAANRIACLSLAYLPHEIDHLRRRSCAEGTDGWVARAEAAVREALG